MTTKAADRTAHRRARQHVAEHRRVVVKVGTRTIVARGGRPDGRRLRALVDELSALRAGGRQVVLVSSGAIGAGVDALGLSRRPSTLPALQVAAAVGQMRLMARYDRLFAERGVTVGQVLLTHDDLRHRLRHLNARNTMMHLLEQGVVPVVNENDAVAVDEIKFGDNDQLAALVAMLVDSPLLVMLTRTNGLRAPQGERGAGQRTRTRRVPYLPRIDEQALALTWGAGDALSTGGMASKLLAAQAAADVGAQVVIADGRTPRVLERVLAGEDVGTLIGDGARARDGRKLPSRKRWIAYFQRSQGTLVVDAGAHQALVERGRSLLPAGVRAVEGRFAIGAVVTVRTEQGQAIARGLVEYGSAEIAKIRGHRTSEIAKILGEKPYDEVIHRDNMVVFG